MTGGTTKMEEILYLDTDLDDFSWKTWLQTVSSTTRKTSHTINAQYYSTVGRFGKSHQGYLPTVGQEEWINIEYEQWHDKNNEFDSSR